MERYGHKEMKELRIAAIKAAQKFDRYGIIFGTLGRQGNPDLLDRLIKILKEKKKAYTILLISEINASVLDEYGTNVDVWVQLCCPRLSVDWGHNYVKPLLNPYEAMVALEQIEWKEVYPMDNYSYEGGPWSSYYGTAQISSKHKKIA